uniref:Metalloproteinase inhibitor 2 n=1 Tax=Sinocyclocheilus grahami TaxID=75366 RepID=A0A672MA64_SINGR
MKSVRSCIGTLVVLVLFRVGEIAEACSCSPVHPQQAFCNADVVIRAKVVGKKEVDSGNDIYGNPIKRIQYEIKQIKMFKGPDRHIDVIFTAPTSAVCGVTNLDTNGKKEYLISGKAEANGKMHVTLCDLIMPWESMSATQKKSLSQRYQMGCDCKVIFRNTLIETLGWTRKGTICKISILNIQKLLAQCYIFYAVVYLCYSKSSQVFVNPEKFQF